MKDVIKKERRRLKRKELTVVSTDVHFPMMNIHLIRFCSSGHC